MGFGIRLYMVRVRSVASKGIKDSCFDSSSIAEYVWQNGNLPWPIKTFLLYVSNAVVNPL